MNRWPKMKFQALCIVLIVVAFLTSATTVCAQAEHGPKMSIETATSSSSPAINLYPNPCSDVASVVLSNGAKPIACTIFNAQGNIVLAQATPNAGQRMQLNVADLAPGYYWLHVDVLLGPGTLQRQTLPLVKL